MNALDLIFANDGVLEGTASLDDEDSIGVTTLRLTSAGDTTTVGLQATIEGTRDLVGLLVGDRALGSRDGQRGALVQAEEGVGSSGSWASSNGGHKGGDRGSDGKSELHFDDCWDRRKALLKVDLLV